MNTLFELAAVVKGDTSQFDTAIKQSRQLFKDFSGDIDALNAKIKSINAPKLPKPSGEDALMKAALADIEKFKASSIKMEQDLTNQIQKQAEAQYQARVKQWQRGLSEYEKILKQEKQASNGSGDIFGGALAGSFLGGVASEGVGMLLQDLQQIPSFAINAEKEVVNLAEALVGLTKSASDYGREIASAQNRTGLTTESLSVLRYAAKLSGKDFSDLQKPINHFAELMGQAAKGSSEAQQKLKALNVTDFNDLDKALQQSLTYINQMPAGYKKITAENDAFGMRGVEVMNAVAAKYGLAADEAKKLGLVLSQDQVNAAREFGTAYERISAQVEGLTAQFGLGLAPALTEIENRFSKFATQNKDDVVSWGKETGNVIRGMIANFDELSARISKNQDATFERGVSADENSPFYKFIQSGIHKINPFPELAKKGQSEFDKTKDIQAGDASFIPKSDYTGEFEKQAEELQKSFQAQQAIQAAGFKLSEARLNDHLNYTIQDQIQSAKAETDLKNLEISQKLASETDYYNKQIALNQGNSEKVKEFQAEITKVEKSAGLDRQTNEINLQHQILELRKQQRDQERSDTLSFYSLQTQSFQQYYNDEVTALQRKISQSVGIENNSFDALINLTNQNYQRLLQISKDSLAEQLKNESLTGKQIQNLKLQENIAEQRLKQENKQKIIQIEDEQRQRQLQIIQKFYEQTRTIQGLQFDNTHSQLSDLISGQYASSEFSQQLSDVTKITNAYKTLNDSVYKSKKALDDLNYGKFGENNGLVSLQEKLNSFGTGDIAADKSAQRAEVESKVNEQLKIRSQLEENYYNIVKERTEFIKQNPLIYGQDQASDLIKTLNTADFSKLDTFTKIQKQLTDVQFNKTSNDLFTQAFAKLKELDSATPNQQKDIEDQFAVLIQKAIAFRTEWDKAIHDINSNSPEGLKKYVQDLPNNPYEKGNIIYGANQAMWQDTKKLAQENIALESEYYKNGILLAEQRKNEILQANKLIYDSENKIAQQWKISTVEIRAGIASDIANQKGLNEEIISGATAIPGIISNAIQQSNGSISSFFKNVALGFAQMTEQILADIAKIELEKAILKIFASLAGSAGSSSDIGTDFDYGDGFASGGFTGMGGKFDAAGIVHKGEFVFNQEATRFWGLGNLSKMLNMQMPSMGFASGGFTGGYVPTPSISSSNTSNKTTNIYQISVHAPNIKNANDFQQSELQIKRSLFSALSEAGLKN